MSIAGGANGSGGPPGERNGQYRHGERTKGAIAERQKFSALHYSDLRRPLQANGRQNVRGGRPCAEAEPRAMRSRLRALPHPSTYKKGRGGEQEEMPVNSSQWSRRIPPDSAISPAGSSSRRWGRRQPSRRARRDADRYSPQTANRCGARSLAPTRSRTSWGQCVAFVATLRAGDVGTLDSRRHAGSDQGFPSIESP